MTVARFVVIADMATVLQAVVPVLSGLLRCRSDAWGARAGARSGRHTATAVGTSHRAPHGTTMERADASHFVNVAGHHLFPSTGETDTSSAAAHI